MYNRDRLREFVNLSDSILAHPWCRDGVQAQMNFTAADDKGHGTWTVRGPSELELRSILLDLRNLIQPRSDLSWNRVLNDFSLAIDDPNGQKVIEDTRTRLTAYETRGTITENGIPVVPSRIVRLWLYSRYQHRDLKKIREVRELDPIARLVYRWEFLIYLQNQITEVAWACDLIEESKRLGYMSDIPMPKRAAYLDALAAKKAAAQGEAATP